MTDMINIIEQNMLAGMKSWECWSGFTLHENSQMVCGLTSIPYHIFNNILQIQAQPGQVNGILQHVQKHNIPLRCWTNHNSRPISLDSYLEANGWIHSFEGTGMAVNLEAFNCAKQDLSDLTIDEANTIDMLRMWAACFADIFNFASFVQQAWYDIHAAMFQAKKPWKHYLASISGRPVAVGSTFIENNVAGIVNIAVLPELRRRGIGTAMTRHLLKEAQQNDCGIGALIATPMARKVYSRLGFEEYYKCNFYKWMPQRSQH